MKLYEIIKKNFKVILRSKSSALIVFLGPLLIILLVGFAFSNSQAFSLRIGTYSAGYTEISEGMIKQLKENNYFVTKFDSESSCIGAIKEGTVNACIIFPSDMKISKEPSQIVFHIDYSKVNLVYLLINSMRQKVEATSSEISLDLTADLINKMNYAQNEANNNIITIAEMIDEKKSLEGKINELQSKVSSMNTEFNKDEFRRNEMNKYMGLIKQDLQGLDTSVISMAANAKEKILFVHDNLTSSGMLGLADELSIAEKHINNLTLTLSTSMKSGDTHVTNLSSIIIDLDRVLDKTAKKLESAEATKAYTAEQIASMRKTITNIDIKIGLLKKSMNDVNAKISSVEVKDAGTIVAPITTRIEPIVVEKSHFNYLFPTLIALVIMITAVLFSATSTVVERNSKSFFRNSIAPVSKFIFDIGHFLSSLIMIVAQLLIFSVFAAWLFKQSFLNSLHTTTLALILISSVFILIGMLLGNIFNTEETAILASITVSSVFLFLSNVVLPLESLPEFIKNIAQFNPFVIADNVLRQTTLYNLPISSLSYSIFLLFDFIIILSILIFAIKKFRKN